MPASLNAYFAKLDQKIDSLSLALAKMTSQVSDLQQRLDDQEARLEAQIGKRKQRKPNPAPVSGD